VQAFTQLPQGQAAMAALVFDGWRKFCCALSELGVKKDRVVAESVFAAWGGQYLAMPLAFGDQWFGIVSMA